MNLLKKLFLMPAAALILLAGVAQANTDEAIAERIKPVGTVCIQGQNCNGVDVKKASAQAEAESTTETAATDVAETPAEPVAAASAGRTGKQIATQSCNVCHGTGILDAPVVGDTAAWQVRADAVGGLDGLLKISKEGKGAMPPMGTCADCTDAELKAAIQDMSGL